MRNFSEISDTAPASCDRNVRASAQFICLVLSRSGPGPVLHLVSPSNELSLLDNIIDSIVIL